MKGGIYILTTPSSEDSFEYRVVHAYDIEKIWCTEGAHKYEAINIHALLQRFGNAKVFKDKVSASDHATTMYYRYELSDPELVNDGISSIAIDTPYVSILQGGMDAEKKNLKKDSSKNKAKGKAKAKPSSKTKPAKRSDRTNLP
jgi:hypothetical protein